MDALLQFFDGIATAITSAFDFVFSFFVDLVYLVGLTGRFLLQIPSYFSFLPDELLASLITLFSLVVLYKIIGREG